MAEVSIDGALTKEALTSHHQLQAQKKEVRGSSGFLWLHP